MELFGYFDLSQNKAHIWVVIDNWTHDVMIINWYNSKDAIRGKRIGGANVTFVEAPSSVRFGKIAVTLGGAAR